MNSRKYGILSLVLGFCSLYLPVMSLLNAGLSIAFGFKARKTKGQNLGIIGMVLGFSCIALNIISLLIMFTYFMFMVFYAILVLVLNFALI